MPTEFKQKLLATWQESRAKILGYTILAGVLIYLWNDYRDALKTMKLQASQISTLSEEFHTLGQAYVGQGALIKSDRGAFKAAMAAQGEDTVKALKDRDAKVMALFESQGRVLEEIRQNQGTTGPVVVNQDGGFAGAKMVQLRKGPALTSVTLKYDPKNPDPSKRLLGDWHNYQETFNQSVGEWQKADGGILGTFRLWREVSVDGTVVGAEEIPLVNAKTSVNTRAFRNMGLLVPRFTLSAGAAWDWQKKQWGPALLGDYRMTDNWGVGGGVAGNQVLVLTSLRFGGK